MKKEAKFVAWMEIKNRGKAPPLFKRWTDGNKEKLLEAQSDAAKMAHTVLGHLKVLKKKELLLAALMMSQNKFDKLAAEREKLIIESSLSAEGNNHPNFYSTSPAHVLIVNWAKNTTVDTFENEG
jgi:hypothetical protein